MVLVHTQQTTVHCPFRDFDHLLLWESPPGLSFRGSRVHHWLGPPSLETPIIRLLRGELLSFYQTRGRAHSSSERRPRQAGRPDVPAARSLASSSCWASTMVRIVGTRNRVNTRAALINTMPGT